MSGGQVKEVSAAYRSVRQVDDCPEGYKRTEVGVIPGDWGVETLCQLTLDMLQGVNTAIDIPEYVEDGVPMLKANNIIDQVVRFQGCDSISQKTYEGYSDRFKLKKNDFLFSNIGARLGTGSLLEESVECSFAWNVMRITPNQKKVVPRFLAFQINSPKKTEQIKSEQSGSGMGFISKATMLKVLLPIPERLVEQTAIANALSDVDALITSLEKLIAKKRAIKTAAMQQLLTGKKRLPPFDQIDAGYKQTELGVIPGDWESGELGSYLEDCSSGATPYRGVPKYYKGNIRWISSGELNYNVINDTIEKISEGAVKRTNLKIHPAGTFLMAITGLEAAGTRGSCGIVGAPSATNQSCMALYPNKKLCTDFLFHYYVYMGDELALKYCQGTKQQSYTVKLVRVLPIIVPETIEEQNAIANVLSDIDKDIESLMLRLNKTQQLKQGMMQELLTGRIRLTEAKGG